MVHRRNDKQHRPRIPGLTPVKASMLPDEILDLLEQKAMIDLEVAFHLQNVETSSYLDDEIIALLKVQAHILAELIEGLEEAAIGEGRPPTIEQIQLVDPTVMAESTRSLLLRSLSELGWPMHTSDLSAYMEAVFGRRVPANRYGSIQFNEERGYDTMGVSSRPVWLVNGIAAADFVPVKRVMGRSDMPLEMRVRGPESDRISSLKFLDKVTSLAMEPIDRPGALFAFRILAADRSRILDARNPKTRKRTSSAEDEARLRVYLQDPHEQLRTWRARAREQIEALEPVDRAAREPVAARLGQLPERVQYFGFEPQTREREAPATDHHPIID